MQTLFLKDGDLNLDASGRPVLVDGATKRDQDLFLALLTKYDEQHPAGPFGNKGLEISLDVHFPSETVIASELTAATDRLMEIQRRRGEPDRITKIKNVVVMRRDDSRTSFMFLVVVEGKNSTGNAAYAISLRHQ